MRRDGIVFGIGLMLTLGGCAGGAGMKPCLVGGDCESGVCFADGTCGPLDAGTPGQDAAMAQDDAGSPPDVDAGGGDGGGDTNPDAGRSGGTDAGMTGHDAGGGGCGNGDGRIDSSELPLTVGETLSVTVATNASVDTHGADQPDGTRVWDLEGPYSGDADANFVRRPLDGTWFAGDFTDASYTLPLDSSSGLLGVFQRTSSAILLRGVVSMDSGVTQTELTYDPPVTVWQLPLAEGASWDETSTVSGTASGVAAYYSERWQVSVDASGSLGTPAGVRQVLRVSTLITRTVGISVTAHRRLSFLQECAGNIAQVSSVDGDGSAEPTYAAELWRIR